MTQYLISRKDLSTIIGHAKQNMVDFNLPLYISDKEVEPKEVPSLAILEAVLIFLSSKKLLTDQVLVSYTDPCAGHDPEPPLEPEEG